MIRNTHIHSHSLTPIVLNKTISKTITKPMTKPMTKPVDQEKTSSEEFDFTSTSTSTSTLEPVVVIEYTEDKDNQQTDANIMDKINSHFIDSCVRSARNYALFAIKNAQKYNNAVNVSKTPMNKSVAFASYKVETEENTVFYNSTIESNVIIYSRIVLNIPSP
jgi:hypothetical protein